MKTFALLAVACVAFSGRALSQTIITQTKSFSDVPDFSHSLVFDKYDGNLSDISKITISYELVINGGRFGVDNDAVNPPPSKIEASFGASLTARSSDVKLLDSGYNSIIDEVRAVNVASFSGLTGNDGDASDQYDAGGTDWAELVGAEITKSGSGDISSTFFSQYVGNNTFTITANSSQIGSLSYNSGISTTTTPVNAKGYITVTYEIVPEPSTTALSGLAAMALILRRRRR
ncbi:PEP-CTERM sorting domain-containing protein [Luteolibacter algae]|uniref:PEP-CTERM sorting domain-containing protein n=1 Tax=Luteolibacter algae TaxID=454151 RepID=A0ABW5D506_9BACT